MSIDAISSAAVSMNCQKSIVDSKLLCSEKRMLHSFQSKKECEDVHSFFRKSYGEYRLDSDITDGYYKVIGER